MLLLSFGFWFKKLERKGTEFFEINKKWKIFLKKFSKKTKTDP